jgi:hypothetical protein
MSAFIAQIHNWWILLPAGIRAGLAYLVASFIAAAQAFGWSFPHSLSEAQAEGLAFVAVFAPVAVAIIRNTIAPAVVRWFLDTFGFAPTYSARATSDAWTKAA